MRDKNSRCHCVTVMGFGSQQNTSVIVNIIYWTAWALGSIPWELALKPIVRVTLHTIHQVSEEIISQRIALKPRLYIHGYNYRSSNYTSTSIRDGHPWRTSASDYCSGHLLRTTTPDNYSRQLLRTTARTQEFSAPSPRTSLASGKLTTRLPVSPAPVMSTSKVAGLGRDSPIHDWGGSSLCWSVACALRPHNPN